MCRTPKHQQAQDELSAQVAAFLRGGGAIQGVDHGGRPAGVVTEDLPSLQEAAPSAPLARPARDLAGLVAELQAIRQGAEACRVQLERIVARWAHE